MNRVTYYWNESSLRHDTGRHVECIARAERLHPDKMKAHVPGIEVRPIVRHDAAQWILRVHEAEHHQFVQEAYARGYRRLDESDTIISEGSYEAALMAVDAALTAADEVMSGEYQAAFCAMRPPGHHALPFMSMGFCLFANAAILARYLQEKHGVRRIAIVDWDVHHGNGTQNVFWEDPDVFFVSLHQHPLWPGSGLEWEKGEGAGEGATLNLIFPPGAEESVYLSRFEHEVVPAVRNHGPEFLIISAGFDSHFRDVLGNLKLTEEGYIQLTHMLRRVAEEICGGRIVSLLEGGYNLSALESSVAAHLSALSV